MKKMLPGLFFLWSTTVVFAQRIEHIRAVAASDTILITYDLVGGNPGQSYKIRASCWDGIGRTDLKTIQGHSIVKPGRNHLLKWKVLDDMELLVGDSITFTLIASEYTPSNGSWVDASLTADDRKSLLFMELGSQVDAYLGEVENTAELFLGYTDGVFTGQGALGKLEEQRNAMNAAYNALLKNRRPFELNIYRLWGDKAKASAEVFFAATLDDMHRNYIMRLNDDVLAKMNEYNTFGGKNYKKKAVLKEIQDGVKTITGDLLRQKGKLETARAEFGDLCKYALRL